jgi:XK-related protein
MVESTEMKIIREETSAKVLGAIMNAALSEQIEFSVTKWDILSNVISIIFRLCAVIFNIILVNEYYNRGEIIFFRMTLCFIIIPAAVSVILSITL